MVADILKIKTNVPPLGTNILSRPRIQGRLEENLTAADGFIRQLTLVSAPAGFGKTTLVRKWLAGREDRTAWYSLDQGDNEPERFWLYLISALQTVESGVGKGPLEMLRSTVMSSDPSIVSQSLLTPLLNDLFALENPVFLVLDDYHLMNNPQIHKDMTFFIENLPPTLHLVVTTRSDPAWPLPRDSHYWRMSVAVFSGDARLFSGNPKDAYSFYLEAHRNSQKIGSHIFLLSSGFKMATSLYYLGSRR